MSCWRGCRANRRGLAGRGRCTSGRSCLGWTARRSVQASDRWQRPKPNPLQCPRRALRVGSGERPVLLDLGPVTGLPDTVAGPLVPTGPVGKRPPSPVAAGGGVVSDPGVSVPVDPGGAVVGLVHRSTAFRLQVSQRGHPASSRLVMGMLSVGQTGAHTVPVYSSGRGSSVRFVVRRIASVLTASSAYRLPARCVVACGRSG